MCIHFSGNHFSGDVIHGIVIQKQCKAREFPKL